MSAMFGTATFKTCRLASVWCGERQFLYFCRGVGLVGKCPEGDSKK